VRDVDKPARHQGIQDHQVAQPTARLLQVTGLRVRELTEPVRPTADRPVQVRQPPPRRPAPVGQHRRAQFRGQGLVPGEVTAVEQPEGGPQVRRRRGARLADGAHRVVQPDPVVPQRVPQAFGHPRHGQLPSGLGDPAV